MLKLFDVKNGCLTELPQPGTGPDATAAWAQADWIDLHDPSPEETKAVEKALDITIRPPATDEPFQQSAQFSVGPHEMTMTASVLVGADTDKPQLVRITFVRSKTALITFSRGAPLGLTSLIVDCQECFTQRSGSSDVFAAILDMFIDHADNILDRVGHELDRINDLVFQHHATKGRRRRLLSSPRLRNRQLENVMTQLGPIREVLVKMRRSIVSFRRMIAFLRDRETNEGMLKRLEIFEKDLYAIDQGEEDLSGVASYLLDGVVGYIGLLQNKVMNVLTLVSIILTPPVVIASIYGMNFKNMPELDWQYGYPMALGMMAAFTIGMYLWVRERGL